MYRLLFIGLALLLSSGPALGATSPIGKGSITVGGGASLSSAGGDDYDSRLTTITMTPSVGLFVADGLLIGGALSVVSMSSGGESLTIWGVGPAIAYYFGASEAGSKEIKRAIYPYVGASMVLNGASGGGDSASGNGFSFGGGVDYMVTSSVALGASATYAVSTMEGYSTNSVMFAGGFTFFIWE